MSVWRWLLGWMVNPAEISPAGIVCRFVALLSVAGLLAALVGIAAHAVFGSMAGLVIALALFIAAGLVRR